MRQPGEPSIEEILESIKQVIAREDRAGAFRGFRAASPEPAADDPAADDDVLDLAQGSYAVPAADGEPLVAEGASRSARSSLDTLAGAVSGSGPAREPAADGGALEGLLRELLRPALAEWLDRNLPAVVERMVAAEIARIAGRK
jgi:cell pole-organizing protein PopZ